MLFAQQSPVKALRVAQNNVTLVGANSDAPRALVFTVPIARKFTLFGVGTDQTSASIDTPALMAFSSDGIFYSTERELAAGLFFSIDQKVQSIRVRNKTVAAIARYDLTGYYSPREVVGVPFEVTEVGR